MGINSFKTRNSKCVVSFSFDVDVDSSWRLKLKEAGMDENEPVVRSIGTYSLTRGLPRVLKLLKKYSIKATFFVPGIIAEERSEEMLKIKDAGHEIAHHGYNHTPPTSLNESDQENEIVHGIKALRDNLGVEPVGYRPPGSGISKATLRALVKNGLIYDSSMMGDDIPYMFKIDNNNEIVEIPWKWSVDDFVFYSFNYYPPLKYKLAPPVNPRTLTEIWKDEFDVLYEEGLFFTAIGHPHQIGQPSRIKALDDFLQYIKTKKNVLFSTYKELTESFKSEN